MATRRKPYTKLKKTDRIRTDHVRGMGDVVFKGFQCLNIDVQKKNLDLDKDQNENWLLLRNI